MSILDATTLAPLAKAQTRDLGQGDLHSVAWSRDGATNGRGRESSALRGRWQYLCAGSTQTGRRQGAISPVSDDTIMDIRPCDKGFAFAARRSRISAFSPPKASRRICRTLGRRTCAARWDRRSPLSRDASSVRFGLGYGDEKSVVFDLAAASLTDSPSLPPGLEPAQVQGLPVRDWEDNYAPKFKAAKLALQDYEMSRALAIRLDVSGFALGTSFSIRAYRLERQRALEPPRPGRGAGASISRPTAK